MYILLHDFQLNTKLFITSNSSSENRQLFLTMIVFAKRFIMSGIN